MCVAETEREREREREREKQTRSLEISVPHFGETFFAGLCIFGCCPRSKARLLEHGCGSRHGGLIPALCVLGVLTNNALLAKHSTKEPEIA